MAGPYTRSYYASNPPNIEAGRLAGAFAGSVQLADVAPAGSFSGFVLPTWAPMAVGTWGQLASTQGPGLGANTDAFCCLTLRPSDLSIVDVASGGHNDGNSNGAARLRLSDNVPAWSQIRASTWNGTESDVLYYADGRPASRHTYYYSHYVAGLDAILLAGCRFAWGGGTPVGPGMDLFSFGSGDYLPRYTYPDITPFPAAEYGVAQDGGGNIWTVSGHKFDITTLTWSKPGSGSLLNCRTAFDSARNRIFAIRFGNGEGGGSGVQARELDPTTGNSRDITINSSAAYTQYVADAPAYAAMAYCTLDEKFYILHAGRYNTFYVITPSASSAWDMTTFVPGGSIPSDTHPLAGRLIWVPQLSGFFIQTSRTSNCRFLRMA